MVDKNPRIDVTVSTNEPISVDVQQQNKKFAVDVKTQTQNPVTVNPNMSEYYSDISKGYAEQAEASAQRAEQSEINTTNIANTVLNNENIQNVANNLEIIEGSLNNAQIAQEQAILAQSYAQQAKTSAEEVANNLDTKQDKLIAGENITIVDNVISATGGGADIDLSEYAKTQDVNTALDTKQDKGDYALKSEIPDTSNFATKSEIPSLTGYVKNTDYATTSKGGVIKTNSSLGTVASNGILMAVTKGLTAYKSADNTMFIAKGTLENVLTQKQDVLEAGANITIEGNIISATGGTVDLSEYAKTQDVNEQLELKANKSNTYTKSEVDDKIADAVTGGEIDLSGYAKNDEVVHLANAETVTGAKTFTQAVKIQNGAGTGSLLIGGDVNAGTVTNGTRKLARVAVPTQNNKDLNAILLGFDSNGDDALKVKNRTYDAISFGGQTKITNATSPMSLGFCVTKTRNSTSASDKVYALEMDSTEARFNVQPNYNGVNLATVNDIPIDYATKSDLQGKQDTLTAGNNITITDGVISASVDTVDAYTKAETDELLNTKQAVGDYALKSELPDTSNLATKEELNTKQDVFSSSNPLELTSKTYSNMNKLKYEDGTVTITSSPYYIRKFISTPTSMTFGTSYNVSNQVQSQKTTGNSLASTYVTLKRDGLMNYISYPFKFKAGEEIIFPFNYMLGYFGEDDIFNSIITNFQGTTTSTSAKHFVTISNNANGNKWEETNTTFPVLPLYYMSSTPIASSKQNAPKWMSYSLQCDSLEVGGNLTTTIYYKTSDTDTGRSVTKTLSLTQEMVDALLKIDIAVGVIWADNGTSATYEQAPIKDANGNILFNTDSGSYTTNLLQLKYDNETLKVVDGKLSTNIDTTSFATKEELNTKQDKLTAGENITIEDGVISASGGSDGGSLPIGQIISMTCSADYVPDGTLPCDGAVYSTEQFEDFYNNYLASNWLNVCTYAEYEEELATYGQCAKFGFNYDTMTEFRVPLIKDGAVIQQALSNTELGKSYKAGLPNITGDITSSSTSTDTQFLTDGGYTSNGALYVSSTRSTKTIDQTSNSATCAGGIGLDASLASNIYGASDTVQPNAVALRYFVVVANGQVNQSMMDWSQWASSLQGKANISDVINKIDNKNITAYLVETYQNGTSWYRVYSDGWCEQGGELNSVTKNADNEVFLLKSYANINYSVLIQATGGKRDGTQYTNGQSVSVRNLSSFIFNVQDYEYGRIWEAKGYIA